MEHDTHTRNTTAAVPQCPCCPRHCRRSLDDAADGTEHTVRGFCNAGIAPEVASVCTHKGEEPVLSGDKGVCNVFFAHCNLQCVYCQNHQISRAEVTPALVRHHTLDDLADAIATVLNSTENILGLVSPTHYAFLVPRLVAEIHARGLHPTVVYNTNAYDDVATLRSLEPYIDVYLPDFKYADPLLAEQLSHAPDYPRRASAALEEMYRQKGSTLITDTRDLATRGIIIRHLVLPGFIDNSLCCLDWIAGNLSTNIHLSLMSQYCPPPQMAPLPPALASLSRRLEQEEYAQVVAHFNDLGFHNGWLQDASAADNYNPDFVKKEAFENASPQQGSQTTSSKQSI